MSELETLPEGWELVSLQDVLLKIVGGGTPSKKNLSYYQGNIPWFSVKDMKSVRPTDSLQHITKEAITESATNLIPANTIVIATRIALGKAIKPTVDFTINQDLKALFLPVGINSDFVLYWIIRNEKMIYDLGSGTTVKGITLETLNNLEFLLPPENEQTRIVEKLEELLSDLDNGVGELKAAQIKLTQYRQSLLKSAVEGSLTAEWRDEQGRASVAEGTSARMQEIEQRREQLPRTPGATKNQPTETGQQLLQRILDERRQRWEQQKLAEFKEKGKKPPKDWKLKYPEPVQPDTSELPELPEGWVWASVDQLAWNKRYGSSSKTNDDASGIPVLRMGNIQDGEIDYGNLKYLPQDHSEFPALLLSDGDLLFNRTNSAELVGKTAVFRDIGKPCSYASYLISVTFCDSYQPDLAAYFINSVLGKAWLSTVVNQTAGQANVNGTKLGELAIPVPPLDEQLAIIQEMNSNQEQVSTQLENVELGIKRSEAQRKNILKDAFAGKLVSQNPEDEPASVLLEKIKNERVAQTKLPKPQKAKKKVNNKASIMDTLFEVLKANGDWMDAQEAFRACGVTDGGDFSDIVDKVESLYAELRKLEKENELIEIRRVGNYDQLKLRNGNV